MPRRKKPAELAKTKRFTMRITESDLDYMHSLAQTGKCSVAELVLRAVKNYKFPVKED